MSVKDLKYEQYKHIAEINGYFNLLESDDINNDLNRAIIKAFKEENKTAYIGFINLSKEKIINLNEGNNTTILEEYVGQTIYNFGANFIIPQKDDILEDLIKKWNIIKPSNLKLLDKIYERIDTLKGINFIWS